jgi:hypothetical protein
MKRRLCLLEEVPKGDTEAALSLNLVKTRLSGLFEYGSTKVDSLTTGTSLYTKFTEFRTIVAAAYNTAYMTDIFNEIKRLYPTEYETTGNITPATIKAYLTGFTAIVSGGPSREHLPISIGSIPPVDDDWNLPTKHVILYNDSLEELYDGGDATLAYIYVEIRKNEPTLSDFDGFESSDITALKDKGIETVELWGYKNGTIYTKLFEGSVDDLKVKSNTETYLVIGGASLVIIIILILLITSGNDSKSRKD